jgi:hypothetical protein
MPAPTDPPAPTLHTDGTVCLEGTRLVKRGFKPCCEAFDQATSRCVHDIRFEWHKAARSWGIALSDGSYLTFAYCPHCGAKL